MPCSLRNFGEELSNVTLKEITPYWEFTSFFISVYQRLSTHKCLAGHARMMQQPCTFRISIMQFWLWQQGQGNYFRKTQLNCFHKDFSQGLFEVGISQAGELEKKESSKDINTFRKLKCDMICFCHWLQNVFLISACWKALRSN